MKDRPFLNFLSEISDGEFLDEIEKQLAILIDECRHSASTGGSGKGSIALSISLRFDRGAADVEGEWRTKLPKKRLARSVFFPTEDSASLTRRDPRQVEMTLRDVPGPTNLKVIT